jgi:hypothetical protein
MLMFLLITQLLSNQYNSNVSIQGKCINKLSLLLKYFNFDNFRTFMLQKNSQTNLSNQRF